MQKHRCRGVREMANLSEKEVGVDEILQSQDCMDILGLRSESCQLIWSEYTPLDVYFLNILSPREMVFWCFGVYAAFTSGYHGFRRGFKKKHGYSNLLHHISSIIGGRTHQPSAYFLLNGIAGLFGDKFLLSDYNSNKLAFRHFSLVLPKRSRCRVSKYFEDLLLGCWDSAFFQHSEEDELVVDYSIRDDEYYPLLGENVCAMSKVVKVDLANAIDRIGVDVAHWRAGNPTKILYSLPGLPDFFVTSVLARDELPLVKKILEFRVNFSLRCCPPTFLQQVVFELESTTWPCLDEFRREIVEQFRMKLVCYQTAGSSPFSDNG